MGRWLALGAVVGGGYSLWHYCLSPIPDPHRSGAAREIAEFMEQHKKYWDTDASTFCDTPAHLLRVVDFPRVTDPPFFCVTRNLHRYDESVPLLRVTTFLPNIKVDEVAPRMLEDAPRKRWDKNYKYFETFATLPVPKQVADMREGFAAVSRHWCGHVLGSATMEKWGFKSRAFMYERIVAKRDDGAVIATYRGLRDNEGSVVDPDMVNKESTIATEALQEVRDKNDPDAKSFAGLLREKFLGGAAKETLEATIYWQELMLIPVRRKDLAIHSFETRKDVGSRDDMPNPTGVTSRLFAVSGDIFTEGNPFTSGLDRYLYHPEAAQLQSSSSSGGGWGRKAAPALSAEEKKELEEVGTLMVMTSANDVKMRALPRVFERYGSKKLTRATVEWLIKDVQDQRKLAAAGAKAS